MLMKLVLVKKHRNFEVLGHVLERVAEDVFVDLVLLVVLRVHEVVNTTRLK